MKDYRTTEEVEQSRCIRPRQQWKPCPCGKKAGHECNADPNFRVKRIEHALMNGRDPSAKRVA